MAVPDKSTIVVGLSCVALSYHGHRPGSCVELLSGYFRGFVSTVESHQVMLYDTLQSIIMVLCDTKIKQPFNLHILEQLQQLPIPSCHYYFFSKTEKIFSNNSPSYVVIYPKLGKPDSARAYMRAAIRGASSRIRRGGRV
jgi:hypothetical protein